jgi:hypothetical protein
VADGRLSDDTGISLAIRNLIRHKKITIIITLNQLVVAPPFFGS